MSFNDNNDNTSSSVDSLADKELVIDECPVDQIRKELDSFGKQMKEMWTQVMRMNVEIGVLVVDIAAKDDPIEVLNAWKEVVAKEAEITGQLVPNEEPNEEPPKEDDIKPTEEIKEDIN